MQSPAKSISPGFAFSFYIFICLDGRSLFSAVFLIEYMA